MKGYGRDRVKDFLKKEMDWLNRLNSDQFDMTLIDKKKNDLRRNNNTLKSVMIPNDIDTVNDMNYNVYDHFVGEDHVFRMRREFVKSCFQKSSYLLNETKNSHINSMYKSSPINISDLEETLSSVEISNELRFRRIFSNEEIIGLKIELTRSRVIACISFEIPVHQTTKRVITISNITVGTTRENLGMWDLSEFDCFRNISLSLSQTFYELHLEKLINDINAQLSST